MLATSSQSTCVQCPFQKVLFNLRTIAEVLVLVFLQDTDKSQQRSLLDNFIKTINGCRKTQ